VSVLADCGCSFVWAAAVSVRFRPMTNLSVFPSLALPPSLQLHDRGMPYANEQKSCSIRSLLRQLEIFPRCTSDLNHVHCLHRPEQLLLVSPRVSLIANGSSGSWGHSSGKCFHISGTAVRIHMKRPNKTNTCHKSQSITLRLDLLHLHALRVDLVQAHVHIVAGTRGLVAVRPVGGDARVDPVALVVLYLEGGDRVLADWEDMFIAGSIG